MFLKNLNNKPWETSCSFVSSVAAWESLFSLEMSSKAEFSHFLTSQFSSPKLEKSIVKNMTHLNDWRRTEWNGSFENVRRLNFKLLHDFCQRDDIAKWVTKDRLFHPQLKGTGKIIIIMKCKVGCFHVWCKNPVKSFMIDALLKNSNKLLKKQQEELIRKEAELKESEGIVCLL